MIRVMNRAVARLLVGVACLCAGVGASAQMPERLAASYDVGHLMVRADWEERGLRGGRGSSMLVAHSQPAELRLVIPAKYLTPPQRVRIYLVLPPTGIGIRSAGSLELAWQTGGRLAPGAGRAGQRVPVFVGIVDTTPLVERIIYTLRIDADDITGSYQFEPYFEIEPA